MDIFSLERLSALHRAAMRRFAQEHGLQMVHLEILVYLSRCNRYSDTTQALSEYLGQTKGSLSQSIGLLEGNSYLRRSQDRSDKRVFHLQVAPKGRGIVRKFDESFLGDSPDEKSDASFSRILRRLQLENGMKSFGLCGSCKYNLDLGQGQFLCGLTKERLTAEETRQICREHEPA